MGSRLGLNEFIISSGIIIIINLFVVHLLQNS